METIEDLGQVLASKVNSKTRTIYLFDEMNDEKALEFCMGLHFLDMTDGDINVWLCSNGGLDNASWAIYDAIRNAKNDVHIMGIGYVQSMAVAIMQAGDTRSVFGQCRLMIHDGSMEFASLEMPAKELEAIAKDSIYQRHKYAEVIAKTSKNDIERIKSWMAEERYFSAKEALKAGLIDRIIGVR